MPLHTHKHCHTLRIPDWPYEKRREHDNGKRRLKNENGDRNIWYVRGNYMNFVITGAN